MSHATPAPPLHPFHTSLWPRAIIWPDEYSGGDRLCISWDLGKVEDKEKKRLIKQWCEALPQMQHLRGLSLWSGVPPALFEAACQIKSLELLQIKWTSTTDLGPIRNLQSLRYLSIGSSTKVASLDPLVALTSLTSLDLENFKLIDDFSPLVAMTNLESLSITGSMTAQQKVASLVPFGQMTWLKSLAVDTANITSLRPLATLTTLEGLGIGGRLPMEEYAWLAAKLPITQCQWFQPYVDFTAAGIGYCDRCKTDSKVSPTGKGKKELCRHCDAEKLRQHVAQFEAIKLAAQ